MKKIIELLYPNRCPICDNVTDSREYLICRKCIGKLRLIEEPFCMKCGKTLKDSDAEYCYDCKNKKHSYIQGTSLFEYNNIADSIYRFKYGGRKEYGEFFGILMARHLGEKIKNWDAQALIPVPIHYSKMRERGYNQAAVICNILGRELGIPVRSDIVERCKKTIPQKNLSDKERQNNLKRAFKISRNDVELDTIVIIDDIYTTGSTIDAMANELQSAGVRNIYYASIAIGKGL